MNSAGEQYRVLHSDEIQPVPLCMIALQSDQRFTIHHFLISLMCSKRTYDRNCMFVGHWYHQCLSGFRKVNP